AGFLVGVRVVLFGQGVVCFFNFTGGGGFRDTEDIVGVLYRGRTRYGCVKVLYELVLLSESFRERLILPLRSRGLSAGHFGGVNSMIDAQTFGRWRNWEEYKGVERRLSIEQSGPECVPDGELVLVVTLPMMSEMWVLNTFFPFEMTFRPDSRDWQR